MISYDDVFQLDKRTIDLIINSERRFNLSKNDWSMLLFLFLNSLPKFVNNLILEAHAKATGSFIIIDDSSVERALDELRQYVPDYQGLTRDGVLTEILYQAAIKLFGETELMNSLERLIRDSEHVDTDGDRQE